MRLSWLGLVALASCAEISGLSNLVVSDGSTPADSGDDATADTGLADVLDGSDAASNDGASTAYCLTLVPGSYLFCADFDEGNIQVGYANTGKSSWTGLSSPAPTLSTVQQKSPPASASFDGKGDERFTLSGALSGAPTTVTMEAQVQVVMIGPFLASDVLFEVITNLSQGRGVKLLLQPTFNGQYSMTVEEDGPGDGSGLVSTHNLAPMYSTGNVWHDIKLTIEMATIVVTVDGISNSITRSQPAPTNTTPTFFVGFAPNWSGFVDNVLLNAK
jgi:hypothetical protein